MEIKKLQIILLLVLTNFNSWGCKSVSSTLLVRLQNHCNKQDVPRRVNLSTIIPAAKIDYSSLTISGFSSGAIMAMQYHFAHSSEVKGVGIFAGFPYASLYKDNSKVQHPTWGHPSSFMTRSVLPFASNLLRVISIPVPITFKPNRLLEAQADSFGRKNLIDSTSNLWGSNVYIFHGTKDPIINHTYGVLTADMYRHYGANVKSKLNMAATHGVPTDNYPTPVFDCPTFGISTDGINNCFYQGIYDMFSHIYGPSYKPPTSSTVSYTGNFYAFSQNAYTSTGNAAADFMDDQGFLYVPLACQNRRNTCKLHIALHGCVQSIYNDLICNLFALRQGYLQVADANSVTIVFPQAARFDLRLNPTQSNVACWDFFGGTSPNYCFKTGPQIKSIRKIARTIAKLY